MRHTPTRQDGFAHVFLFALGLVVLGVIGFAGFRVVHKQVAGIAPTATDKSAKFVSAAPFDPEQMVTVSKFRSCSGHDYSGKNIDGVVEDDRSMKNYAVPLKSLSDTKNKVKILAPFDGVVVNNSIGKRGDNLNLSPTASPGYMYELGHIEALDNLSEGTTVKAGQLLGYYNDSGAFDIQFWYGNKHTMNTLQGYFDSLFSHMTPELETKLTPYGLTADALVVTKAFRDAHPCEYNGTNDNGDGNFKGDITQDAVVVKNKAAAEAPQATPNQMDGSGASSAGGTAKASGSASSPGSADPCAASIPVDQQPPGCKH